MNTILSHNVFIKMRDTGKFSKKSEGRHSYFLYLDLDDNGKYETDNHSLSPPPAPRYRNNSIEEKYFNTKNLPSKYHVNQNIQ